MVMSVSSVRSQHGTSAAVPRHTPTFATNRPAASTSSARQPSFRSNIPCKFFASGCCFRGDQCHFSHDANAQQNSTLQPAAASVKVESNSSSTDEDALGEQTLPLPAKTSAASNARYADGSMPLAWTLTPAPPRLSQPPPPTLQQTAEAIDDDDVVAEQHQQQQQRVCKFFLRGMCAHGDDCRYIHRRPPGSMMLRPEACERDESSPQAAARVQMHHFVPPARQVSLELPYSAKQNPSSSAEFVHQSMLGKGVSHSSLLDADAQSLLDFLPGPSKNDKHDAKNERNISSRSSPSTTLRRTSVSHADKGNVSYAAALSSSSISSSNNQPLSKETRENIFGEPSKGIAIRRQHRASENIDLASQSVPILSSSSGSFFDMLSSDQDSFNYTLRLSSDESDSNSAIPTNEVGNSSIYKKCANVALNQLPTRRVSFNGKPSPRGGVLSELPTVKEQKMLLPTHEQQINEMNEIESRAMAETFSNGGAAWWSLATPTPSMSGYDQSNNTGTDNSDFTMPPIDCFFGALAGTTDDDDHQTYASHHQYNAMPTIMPEMFDGDADHAAACFAAAAAAAVAFDSNNQHIPFLGESSAAAMLMNNDIASGNGMVVYGEVFYSPTPPHNNFQQQQLTFPYMMHAGTNDFSMLNSNEQNANESAGNEDAEWHNKRFEGQLDLFPHNIAGMSAHRIPVCRAGLAGRCTDKDCMFRHDLTCEMCGCEAIDPEDPDKHMRECMAAMEINMQLSFNIARSQHRECNICQEEIMESNRRFGLLPNCKHVFCLPCIRNWRDRKQQGYDKEAVRGCPLCRIKSDFVLPSQYFLDDDDEKQKVIEQYQQEMKKIHCKYFNRGAGDCPFGDSCFYLHTDRRGQPITGLRPLYDSHTLLGCASIEVDQSMTQRQRRQQRRQQLQQQQQLNIQEQQSTVADTDSNTSGSSSSAANVDVGNDMTINNGENQNESTVSHAADEVAVETNKAEEEES